MRTDIILVSVANLVHSFGAFGH